MVFLKEIETLQVTVERISSSKSMKCFYYGGIAINSGKKPEEHLVTMESNQLKLVGPRVPVHRLFPCCTRNKTETIPLNSITDIFVAQDSFYFA